MSFNLMIVESPHKAATISKIIAKGNQKWFVRATKGHILDLPVHEHGVEVVQGKYHGKWVFKDGKKDLIADLRKLAATASNVYVATDNDREGERIADDVVKQINLKQYYRVVFPAITEKAIKEGIANARLIDEQIVAAQVARRLIDREIGYKVSSIIKKDFQKNSEDLRGVGVGRVVSPALHLLTVREREIEDFIREKTYRLAIDYIKDGVQFQIFHKTVFKDDTREEMNSLLAYLGNKNNPHIVEIYKPSTKEEAPFPPLITSRMQRGGFYLMGYEPDKTMKLAQNLFEAGLITYHRTSSYNIDNDAVIEMIRLLNSYYPEKDVLQKKRIFKAKNAGEASAAHEAIRPTYFQDEFNPERIRKHQLFLDAELTEEHRRLYEYIWYITLSTQMVDSVYDVSELTIRCGQNTLHEKAHSHAFEYNPMLEREEKILGWEKLRGSYIKTAEREADEDWKDKEIVIPRLHIGEQLNVVDIKVIDGHTRRPPRYGIGRFITTLEHMGIGKPSTFALIYEKLVKTGCVSLINKQMLKPTELGFAIDQWIEEHAPWMVDAERAKDFEDLLEAIEKGEIRNCDKEIAEYTELINKLAAEKGYVPPVSTETQKKEALCRCSICKGGKILTTSNDKGRFYHCSTRNCLFLTDKSVDGFFSNFGLNLDDDERSDALKKVLSKKSGYQFELYSSKKQKKFTAAVVVAKNDKGYWGLSFPEKGSSKQRRK